MSLLSDFGDPSSAGASVGATVGVAVGFGVGVAVGSGVGVAVAGTGVAVGLAFISKSSDLLPL